jgi:hypothetical protein
MLNADAQTAAVPVLGKNNQQKPLTLESAAVPVHHVVFSSFPEKTGLGESEPLHADLRLKAVSVL